MTLLPCLVPLLPICSGRYLFKLLARWGRLGADGSVFHTWMKSHVIAGKRCQALFAQRMMRLTSLMTLLR